MDVTLRLSVEDYDKLTHLLISSRMYEVVGRLRDSAVFDTGTTDPAPIERYCVIAPKATNRTWCASVQEAVTHGTALLRKSNNPGDTLLVVAAVEMLTREVPVVRRGLKIGDVTDW